MTEKLFINFGSQKINYELIFKQRKQLAIHVHPDLSVQVEAPPDTEFALIEEKLRKRAPWILRQQQELQRYYFEIPPREYVDGESYRYLGKQGRLKIIPIDSGYDEVKWIGETLELHTSHPHDKAYKAKRINRWYHEEAEWFVMQKIREWYPRFELHGAEFPYFQIRKMKRRWGTCSPDGQISLNQKLIQAPPHLFEYILVHEMTHLVHHNHGPAFYKLLSRMMPDWEQRRDVLNQLEI
jgi:predicted metal-dependent hydrolase